MYKNISIKLKTLPTKPGIYQFFNNKTKILYIGKAKNLKNRVRSYFSKTSELTPAKQKMVAQIADINYTIVDNETEALLLETNLIKKHKPPFNIILKDDKDWQYIKIDYQTFYPQIYAVRRPDFSKQKKTYYFGPYTSSVKETLRLIKKIFPICLKPPKKGHPELVSVSKKTLKRVQGDNRNGCFNYHLGRCPGPCVGKITPTEYAQVFEDVKKFIKGKNAKLTRQLTERMRTHSRQQHFEAAARTRDQIKALQKLNYKQKVVSVLPDNFDVISLYRDDSLSAVNVFKIRQGKLLDKFNTLVKAMAATDGEIVRSFIEQYYPATTDQPEYIVAVEKLPVKNIMRIPVRQAFKGKKMQLIKLGTINAKEFFMQQANFTNHNAPETTVLRDLKTVLKLPLLPKRIETFDISNIQGHFSVGSMVVMENGRLNKAGYRKFKIRLKMTPDDPAMINEVLSRRLRYLANPKSTALKKGLPAKRWGKQMFNSFEKTPSLIVIDGGIAQLNAALAAQVQFGLKIPMIGLAKKQEEIYLPDENMPLKMSPDSPALQILQQGRDEAHRFAIKYYRWRHQQDLLDH